MPMEIYAPGDWFPDNGDQGCIYPIEPEQPPSEIVYDRSIQQTSYIQANMTAIFDEWFQSFFEPDYFKYVRIKTEASLAEFKSFMKQIYKKDKPFLVIDPHPPELVEDSLFGQNMLNRYNMLDPVNENIGAKLLYSLSIMRSDLFELVFRRNRYRFEFDTMIMEQTTNRQINTYNMILMNIRHNSKFMLYRTVPMLIPTKFIQNIASFHGYNWKSEQFLNFMNSISDYPIIRRVLPSGQYMFFMQQNLNVQVEVPGYPTKDTAETSEAIELGARVMDSFTLIADLPTEFIFLTEKENITKYDKSVKEDPETITFISPVYRDMDWPTEINGYKLTNRIDLMVQEDEKPTIQIIPLIKDYNEDMFNLISEFITRNGKLSDLVMVKVYPNGSYQEIGSELANDGLLTVYDPKPNKLYTANVYLNLSLINTIREERHKEHIGTITK